MVSKLMGKYLIIIAVIILLISSSEAYAIVSHWPVSERPTLTDQLLMITLSHMKTYTIAGEITSMDVNQVRNILHSIQAGTAQYGDSPIAFILDSRGGDIYAAMEIGKLIRKARARCVIPQGAKCYSACVLILSGGIERMVLGEVGIHRPYSTYVGNRDYESTQNEYRRLETAVRAYLTEMNLGERLFEAMVRVPPEEIRILSNKETEGFGLSGTDPVEQETRDAMDASHYGISKTEYLRRKASVDNVCPPTSFEDMRGTYSEFQARMFANAECYNAYMWGLSVPTWKARKARAVDVCSRYQAHPDEYRSCLVGVLKGDR